MAKQPTDMVCSVNVLCDFNLPSSRLEQFRSSLTACTIKVLGDNGLTGCRVHELTDIGSGGLR